MYGCVQGQLQLAPWQEQAFCVVHDMLSSNLAQLLAERRTLVGRLQVVFRSSNVVMHASTHSAV